MSVVHWRTTEPFSWPSGGKRNPNMRTFLLPGNVPCHALPIATSTAREDVTCKRCLKRMAAGRVDTKETIDTVMTRGTVDASKPEGT